MAELSPYAEKCGDLAAHVAALVMQHSGTARLRLATPNALPLGGRSFMLKQGWRLVVSPWDELPEGIRTDVLKYLEPYEVGPARAVPKGESKYTREAAE